MQKRFIYSEDPALPETCGLYPYTICGISLYEEIFSSLARRPSSPALNEVNFINLIASSSSPPQLDRDKTIFHEAKCLLKCHCIYILHFVPDRRDHRKTFFSPHISHTYGLGHLVENLDNRVLAERRSQFCWLLFNVIFHVSWISWNGAEFVSSYTEIKLWFVLCSE